MSWDLLLANHAEEEDRPVSLGKRSVVLDTLAAHLPGIDLSDPTWGLLIGADYTIEIAIGAADPIESITLHVRGANAVLEPIEQLVQATGWQAVDLALGEPMEWSADAPHRRYRGLQRWRSSRNAVASHMREQGHQVLIDPLLMADLAIDGQPRDVRAHAFQATRASCGSRKAIPWAEPWAKTPIERFLEQHMATVIAAICLHLGIAVGLFEVARGHWLHRPQSILVGLFALMASVITAVLIGGGGALARATWRRRDRRELERVHAAPAGTFYVPTTEIRWPNQCIKTGRPDPGSRMSITVRRRVDLLVFISGHEATLTVPVSTAVRRRYCAINVAAHGVAILLLLAIITAATLLFDSAGIEVDMMVAILTPPILPVLLWLRGDGVGRLVRWRYLGLRARLLFEGRLVAIRLAHVVTAAEVARLNPDAINQPPRT